MEMAFSLLRERLRYPAGSRESDLFDTVHEEMQRLVRLINDLLNFSRYQSGQQKLELEQCHIPELLEAARQRFEVNAADQEVQLKLELQQPLPKIGRA